MVTTGEDMLRFVSAFGSSRIGAVLGWPEGTWEDYIDPGQGRYGMGITIRNANGHVLIGHAGTTMGYDAGFTAVPAEGVGWFVLENGNGGVFLKPELDRLFLQWKAESVDPRHRVLRWLRGLVAFLAIMLPALAALLLASLAVSFISGQRSWAAARRLAPAAKALRVAVAVLLSTGLLLWVVFFHTEAFYPAFTTAWMPFAFRYVTLGVALFVLRGVLSCVLVKEKRGAAA